MYARGDLQAVCKVAGTCVQHSVSILSIDQPLFPEIKPSLPAGRVGSCSAENGASTATRCRATQCISEHERSSANDRGQIGCSKEDA